MRVVTTVHKDGFEQYGHRWIESIKNWPKGAEFWMYAEGFKVPDAAIDDYDLYYKRTEHLPRLQAFKERFKHYIPIDYRWDIVRFSNKVFAAYDAFYNYDGLGVWLDADCVTYEPLPEGYIEKLLPKGCYMAQFDRVGMYTETGFWLVDCSHPKHKEFFDSWLEWFESDAFKSLDQWHDCTTLDATTRVLTKAGVIKVASLSGQFAKEMHPMAKVDLGRYIDHCKGARKQAGVSPENQWRAA